MPVTVQEILNDYRRAIMVLKKERDKVIEPYSNTEFRKNVCVKCDDRKECTKTDGDIQNCLVAFTPYDT